MSPSLSDTQALEDRAKRMAAALHHRGPDDSGNWVCADNGLALAHARLSIIDLSAAGHQPMVSKDGRFVICYNGEIYNHRLLRSELEEQGAEFVGHSDTETAVEYIARFGVEPAVRRFNGMFAIALWSVDEQCLYLIRDRVGIKPLYYGQCAGAWVFASELKAVYSIPERPRRISTPALAAYMRQGYVPDDECIFEELTKQRAGTIVRIKPGDSQPEVSTYWSLADVVTQREWRRADSIEDHTDHLQESIRASVRRRMIADVPLGAFLSGGIDSSLIVAVMSELSDEPVHTFTIGFEEAQFDESVYAQAVSERLGTRHHRLAVTAQDALDLIPQVPRIYDEPFADASQLPTILVSRLAAGRVKVALSGDGGDELFCGYTRYPKTDKVWGVLRRLPLVLRRLSASAVRAPTQRGEVQHTFLRLAAMLDSRNSAEAFRSATLLMDDNASLVRGDPKPSGRHLECLDIAGLSDLDEIMTYTDFVTYLTGDILTKVDRASMSTSLEARVPLLDHEVVEAAWSVPTRFRGNSNAPKRLLRNVLHRYLDADLFDRPKAGFGIPLAEWLRGPLRDWAEDLIRNRDARLEELLNFETLTRSWTIFLAGRDNQAFVLWNALMFLSWYAEWRDEPAS